MKTALITGGSRGIGLGIALCLAKEGYDLAINGVREESLVKETLAELRSHGIKVIYCQGDISTENGRKSMVEKVKREFGQLNVLINNAGVAPKERNDILKATEESFDYVIGTNLKGTYFLTQSVANWMVEQKLANDDYSGCIVTVSSISATVASVNRGEYCIAKAGLSMVTQLFAARLGEYQIPVYEIRPGVIATDMTAGVKAKYDAMFENGLAVQSRWGLPDDIGKAAAALCRGDFPYSTGQVIMVDGGMTIQRL
ncbi:MAG: 3-ketoacyl-ACP reductase [Cyclobacteriaceae bacterium]|nr:3-ketoacyl-ACP reductase [Cyclobacteriaceae bacterium]